LTRQNKGIALLNEESEIKKREGSEGRSIPDSSYVGEKGERGKGRENGLRSTRKEDLRALEGGKN